MLSKAILTFSEGRALAAVVEALPGKPYGTRVGADFPRRLRQPWRGGARRVRASHGAPRLEGEEMEGATPGFPALMRHRAGEMVHAKVHHFPPRFWCRSLPSDPWREGHRAPFSRSRLMSVSPCSVVSCLLLSVSLWVGVVHRVPLHVRVFPEPVNGSSASAPSGTSTSASGCAPSSTRSSKNTRPQMA